MASADGPSTAANTESRANRRASSIYSPDLRTNGGHDRERPWTAPAAAGVEVDPAAASSSAPESLVPSCRPRSLSESFTATRRVSVLLPMPSPPPAPGLAAAGDEQHNSPMTTGPPETPVAHHNHGDDDPPSVPVPWSMSPHRSPVPMHLGEPDFSSVVPPQMSSVKSIIASIQESNEAGLGLMVSPTESEMDQKEPVVRQHRQQVRPDLSTFFSDKIPITTEPSLIPLVSEAPKHAPPPIPVAELWNPSTTSLSSLPGRSATTSSRHALIPVPPPRSQSTPPVLVVPAQQGRPNTRWPRIESASNSGAASPAPGRFEFRFSDRIVFHQNMVPQVTRLEEPDRNFTVELEGDSTMPLQHVPQTPRSPPVSMRRRSQQLPLATPTIPEDGSAPKRSASGASWPRSEYTSATSELATVTDYQTSIEEEPEHFYAAEKWKPAPEVELVTLWNNAQGIRPMEGDGRAFNLNIFPRFTPDPLGSGCLIEDFAFGLSAMSPFYTLRSGCVEHTCVAPATCRNHNQQNFGGVTISRHMPLETENTEHICKLKLPSNGRAAPDGLVTLIDPQRAVKRAMQAINPTIQTAMRSGAAVNLTLRPESCSIVWSRAHRHYELIHPKLAPMPGCPSPLVFEITGGRVGLGDIATGTLRLINKINNETLAMLDFGSSSLTVDTSATSKIESENIVDVAVVATIAVATVEGRLSRLGLAQGHNGSSPPTINRYASSSIIFPHCIPADPNPPRINPPRSPTHSRPASPDHHHPQYYPPPFRTLHHAANNNHNNHNHKNHKNHNNKSNNSNNSNNNNHPLPPSVAFLEDQNFHFSSDEDVKPKACTRVWSRKSNPRQHPHRHPHRHPHLRTDSTSTNPTTTSITPIALSTLSRPTHKKKAHKAQSKARMTLEEMRRRAAKAETDAGKATALAIESGALGHPPQSQIQIRIRIGRGDGLGVDIAKGRSRRTGGGI